MLLHWGAGELPSAVIVDLPQLQSVINRYYFAARQHRREIVDPTENLFSTCKPSWWPSTVTDVREWQAPQGTVKVLLEPDWGKKERSQITNCVLTNHIKVKKKPELKKITTFIFFLIFGSSTVCAAACDAIGRGTNERFSCRRQRSAHAAGRGAVSRGELGRLGGTRTPRIILADFVTSACVVRKWIFANFLSLHDYVNSMQSN